MDTGAAERTIDFWSSPSTVQAYKLAVLMITVSLVCGAFVFYSSEPPVVGDRTEVNNLRDQVKKLGDTLEEKNALIEELLSEKRQLEREVEQASQSAQEPDRAHRGSDRLERSKREEGRSVSIARVSAGYRIAGIEKLLVLSEDERMALRDKFVSDYEDYQSSRETEQEFEPGVTVAEILGRERFDEYLASKKEFDARVRRERQESELFTYSRKLTLSPRQEREFQGIIERADEEFYPVENDDGEPKYYTPAERRAYMVEQLRKEAQRRKYVAEQARRFLEDSQYNSLLEYQESSPSTIAHSQVVAEADRDHEGKTEESKE